MCPDPLIPQPARQAVDLLGGIRYQLQQSLYAWLTLRPEEAIVLEGAEDFDVLGEGSAITAQVKRTAKPISLNSAAVIEALNNFWTTRSDNPDRRISYRYITTAAIGRERKPSFPGKIPGLSLWKRRDAGSMQQLQSFLAAKSTLRRDLRAFLGEAPPDQFRDEVLERVQWLTAAAGPGRVDEAIADALVTLGEGRGVDSETARRTGSGLLNELLIRASTRPAQMLTRVRLLELFDEATRTSLTPSQITALTYGSLSSPSVPTLLLPGTVSLSISQRLADLEAPPPLPGPVCDRERLVARLATTLQEHNALCMCGLSGMGKSTLAHLTARACSRNWRWIHCRDIAGAGILTLLRSVRPLVSSVEPACSLVLDDLPLAGESSHEIRFVLGAILHASSARGQLLLITTDRSLSSRQMSQVGLPPESISEVPALTLQETQDLVVSMGCTDPAVAKRWAHLVTTRTSGHPQLTCAALRSVADRQWPAPALSDFAEPNAGIEDERRAVRRYLQNQLPEESRRLLYELGVIPGVFRRDHALAIASRSTPSTLPGDAFDALVGTWVADLGNSYFSLSPLVSESAEHQWCAADLRRIKGETASAILSCGRLTQLEGYALLLLAIGSQDPNVMVPILMGLAHAPHKVIGQMAKLLPGLPSWGLSPRRRLFSDNSTVNFLLRMFQFRVAVATGDDNLPAIATAWREEISRDDPLRFLQQFQHAVHVLIEPNAASGPHETLALVPLIEESVQHHPELVTLLPHDKSDYGFPASSGCDWRTVMMSFVAARCARRPEVVQLLQDLDAMQPALRSRLLQPCPSGIQGLRLAVDAVWLPELEEGAPDWTQALACLEDLQNRAIRWGALEFAMLGCHARAVIYSEHMDRTDEALRVCEAAAALCGQHPLLADAVAAVHFHRKDYQKATEHYGVLWGAGGLGEQWSDPYGVMSCRNAARTAARLDSWSEAAALYLTCARRAKHEWPDAVAGFLADASLALWRAGNRPVAIEEAIRAVEMLEELSVRESRRGFVARKLIGHLLMWMVGDQGDGGANQFECLPSGACSNPQVDKRIEQLPETSMALCWLLLSKLQWSVAASVELWLKVRDRVFATGQPGVAFTACDFALTVQLSRGELEGLVGLVLRMGRVIRTFRKMESEGVEPWLPYAEIEPDGDGAGEEGGAFSGPLYMAAFMTALCRGGAEAVGVMNAELRAGSCGASMARCVSEGSKVLERTSSENAQIAADGAQTDLVRVLSSAAVAFAVDASLRDQFIAQVRICERLIRDEWLRRTAPSVAGAFEQVWRRWVEQPALLRVPRLTVPNLLEACELKPSGIAKCAAMVLAASSAVGAPLSEELRATLASQISPS